MSKHAFPVRSTVRPASGLVTNVTKPSEGLGYMDPFLDQQEARWKVSIAGCDCGMNGLLDNAPLFTVPGTDFQVTKRHAVIGGAVVGSLVLLKVLFK